MSNDGTPDDQIGEALVIRVVQDQMVNITTGGKFCLPVVKPLHSMQHQKLLDELAKSVRVIGDQLNHEQNFNNQIDGLARKCDQSIFSKLVEGVFSDGTINWGRIIVLFYAVGKLAVKMVLANLPAVFSQILESCLEYFRTKLLGWIRSVGGWISSISAMTQFSIEHVSASSFSGILSAEHIFIFVCGVALGSIFVWKLSRTS